MSQLSPIQSRLTAFYADQAGRSALAFTAFIACLCLVAVGAVGVIMTNGDPMGAYERMAARMYWQNRCKENVPGACQMAKIQW